MKQRLILVGLILASVAAAGVAQSPPASAGRVLNLPYSADHATLLSVAAGYAALVELGSDERIENVVVGDSGAWQVTPTKQGDRLVIKPLASSNSTDLIVITSNRRYLFLLRSAQEDEGGPLVVRFDYPQAVQNNTTPPIIPGRYKLRGDRALFPSSMSDDGNRTFVTWKPDSALPAIFAADEAGHEALVNGRMVGSAYVIEGVANRYVLRRDSAEATAVRQKIKAER